MHTREPSGQTPVLPLAAQEPGTPVPHARRIGSPAELLPKSMRESAASSAAYRCRDGDIAGAGGAERPPGLYSVKLHAWVGEE